MLNLVTGATGLVGSHLVEALVARGDRVRALVRPTSATRGLRELGVELRVGTLQDNATLMSAAAGVDRIYHCAALVSDWGQLADFEQTNVQGVRNILAAATRAQVTRFIYLSTTDIYGFPGKPALESERPSPRGFDYADTKIQGEGLVWNHYRRVKLPVTILRPATVYGPRAQLLVRAVVEALQRRRMILVDGGSHLAGVTYVGNLVDALILAAENDASVGQAYNISDGSDVTWKQYVDALADLARVPRPARNYSHGLAYTIASLWEGYYRLLGRTERPALTRLLVELMGTDQDFPIAKAREELGYQPRVSFEEGMRYTGDWLRRIGVVD
ncbi:MAG: NAD-dependent epimerase/dehydratase family protein [Anaerolineae bacterium]|nr:NAD-dependent epimerase/dehydratase family protein [Anaerolineae bacterium]